MKKPNGKIKTKRIPRGPSALDEVKAWRKRMARMKGQKIHVYAAAWSASRIGRRTTETGDIRTTEGGDERTTEGET